MLQEAQQFARRWVLKAGLADGGLDLPWVTSTDILGCTKGACVQVCKTHVKGRELILQAPVQVRTSQMFGRDCFWLHYRVQPCLGVLPICPSPHLQSGPWAWPGLGL